MSVGARRLRPATVAPTPRLARVMPVPLDPHVIRARVAGAAGARRFTRPHRPGGSAAVTAGGRDRAPGPESHVDQGVLASHGPGVGLERRSLVRAAARPRSLGRRPLSEGAGRHSLQPWTLVAR